jgi:hypothetical protein
VTPPELVTELDEQLDWAPPELNDELPCAPPELGEAVTLPDT